MENQINRANRPDAERQAEKDGLVSHLKAILEVFRNSSRRGTLLWLGAGLALVVGATVYGQIKLNAWSRPFYDALSRKDLSGFRLAASRVRRHRRGAAGSERRPNLAQSNDEGDLARRIDAGLVRSMALSETRLSSRRRRRGRGESGPAHSRGRPSPRGTLDRSLRRPLSSHASFDELRRSCFGSCRQASCSNFREEALSFPAIWSGARSFMRAWPLGELARRAAAYSAQRGTLRPRIRSAIRARARQRACRGDRRPPRRGGREKPPSARTSTLSWSFCVGLSARQRG